MDHSESNNDNNNNNNSSSGSNGENQLDPTGLAPTGSLLGNLVALEPTDMTAPTFNVVQPSKVPYGEFSDVLTRPIKVYSGSWSVGQKFDTTLYPAGLWGESDFITRKLRGYGRFRADFRVRVQISASPFHYGGLQVGFFPLEGSGGATGTTCNYRGVSWLYDMPPNTDMDLKNAWLSTKPGVFMSVSEDASVEYEHKFMYPAPWIDMVAYRRPNGNFAPLDDYLTMVISSVSTLGAVSTTAPNVSVNVWVQAVNVELSAPTSLVQLQSGVAPPDIIVDWQPIPPVDILGPTQQVVMQSGFLSTSANAIEPVLTAMGMKRYARAVKHMGAAVSLLGLCNTQDRASNIVDPERLLSLTDGSRVLDTTAVASRGLATDRTPGALSIDEMGVEWLCNHEMLIAAVAWSPATAVDALVQSVSATPFINRSVTKTGFGSQTYYHKVYTPMGNVARLFKYWRGDIVVRVKVLASKMHRGKLRLMFNPAGQLTAVPSEGYVLSEVLDLATGNEITMTLPYDSSLPMLTTYPDAWSNSEFVGSAAPYENGGKNGVFSIFVMNELVASAPDATDPTILIYVSGKNMDFACPVNPTAPGEYALYDYTGNQFMAINVNHDVGYSLQSGDIQSSGLDKDYIMGEKVKSVRDLAMRLHPIIRLPLRSAPALTGEGLVSNQFTMSRVPLLPTIIQDTSGAAPFPKVTSWDGNVYTDSKYMPLSWTPLTYLSTMYLGHKGGVRWHSILPQTTDTVKLISAKLEPAIAQPKYAISVVTSKIDANTTAINRAAMDDYAYGSGYTGSGYGLAKASSTGAIDVVMHDYSPMYFRPSADFRRYRAGSTAYFDSTRMMPRMVNTHYDDENFMLYKVCASRSDLGTGAPSALGYTDLYAAAAPDFRFIGYMGSPVMVFFSKFPKLDTTTAD